MIEYKLLCECFKQHEILFEFRFSLLMPLSQLNAHSPAHPENSLVRMRILVSGGKRLRELERKKEKSSETVIDRLFILLMSSEPNETVYKW